MKNLEDTQFQESFVTSQRLLLLLSEIQSSAEVWWWFAKVDVYRRGHLEELPWQVGMRFSSRPFMNSKVMSWHRCPASTAAHHRGMCGMIIGFTGWLVDIPTLNYAAPASTHSKGRSLDRWLGESQSPST